VATSDDDAAVVQTLLKKICLFDTADDGQEVVNKSFEEFWVVLESYKKFGKGDFLMLMYEYLCVRDCKRCPHSCTFGLFIGLVVENDKAVVENPAR